MDIFYYKLFFQFMEAFAFILPALPSSIWTRLSILLIYLTAHYYKLQYKYVQFKNKYITPRNSIEVLKTHEIDESTDESRERSSWDSRTSPSQIDSSLHDVPSVA